MRCGNVRVLKVLQNDKHRTKAIFKISKVYYIMVNSNFSLFQYPYKYANLVYTILINFYARVRWTYIEDPRLKLYFQMIIFFIVNIIDEYMIHNNPLAIYR